MSSDVERSIELHQLTATPISSSPEGKFQPEADDDNASKNGRKPTTSSSRKHGRRSYLSMVAIAIFLVIFTPRSKLWMSFISCSSSSSMKQHNIDKDCKLYYGSPNLQILIKQTLWIFALIFSFTHLQGSNPGVLKKEFMERLDSSDDPKIDFVGDKHTSREDNDDDFERQTFLEKSMPSSSSPSPLDLSTTLSDNISCQQSNALFRSTRRKYCTKCKHQPPLRSHHCKNCDICVATFDHHCHFMDTCIGERNHWRFWWFLLLNVGALKTALDIVNSSAVTLTAFVYDQGNSVSSSNDDLQLALACAITIIAKLYLYPIFIISWILLTVHTLLAMGNVTTFEFTKAAEIDYLRGTRIMDFPFGNGICKNLSIFLRRDDLYRSLCLLSKAQVDRDKSELMDERWVPIEWIMPELIDRESKEWWNHPLQNQYWQCC